MQFADDMDDPSADLIFAALVLNARLRGPGLREVLSALAVSAREELDMRRHIEAERAVDPAQRAGRRRDHAAHGGRTRPVQPDVHGAVHGFVGQVVLAVVIALYALGLIWLRRLAKIEVPERFLIATARRRPNLSGEQRMEVVDR